MSKLSVAIIGAGNIAGGYDQNRLNDDSGIYSHAGAYAASGKFSLKTVFDSDRQRAESFRGYWKAGTVAPEIADVYRVFHDVVSVCAPDDTHFEIVRTLLENRCCRTVFLEKPAAMSAAKTEQLEQRARAAGVDVIVNFQRRNEAAHQAIRDRIAARPEKVLAASGYYIKGLRHIGITMIDTLTFLLGYPDAVLAYNRVYNQEVSDYSYEFILFFGALNVSVRTTDVEKFSYNYHIFEIDLLFADRRLTLLDNSRLVRESGLGEYAYSGVKVLDDRSPTYAETGLARAMAEAVEYVYRVTTDEAVHATNTLAASYNNALIVERIIQSFEQGFAKLDFEQGKWKR